MKSKDVLYSTNPDNIEALTPRYGIIPLLEFIPKNIIIWCPFDQKDSEFVKVFVEHGCNVIYSHIEKGQDFMIYEPKCRWDMIISNPPFKNKRKTVERALSFGKPFCLLLPLTWLNDAAPKQVFMEKDLELLMFDKRIKFGGQSQRGDHVLFGLLLLQILAKANYYEKVTRQMTKTTDKYCPIHPGCVIERTNEYGHFHFECHQCGIERRKREKQEPLFSTVEEGLKIINEKLDEILQLLKGQDNE